MLAAAIFLMTAPALAFDVEEDMSEGITLSMENGQQSDTVYKYDSRNANDTESMTEYNFFSEKAPQQDRFAGDPTSPSRQKLMNEGICLESFSGSKWMAGI